MSAILDIATDPPPVPTSATIITAGCWRLLIFVRQNSAFVFTLISFVLLIYTSNSEFMKLALFSCYTYFLSRWFVDILIFSSERILVIKWSKALYFLFYLKKSLFYFLCSTLNLVPWLLYMKPDMRGTNLFHNLITATLVAIMSASIISIIKILGLKQLACQFHDKDFFDEMKQLIDQEYVLQTLLFGTATIKFHIISDAVRRPFDQSEVDTLFTLAVHKFTNGDVRFTPVKITQICKNVMGTRDILETDFQSFMGKADVAQLLRLFEAEETKIISQTRLKNWIVKICKEREALVHRLSHTSIVEDLNNIINMCILPLLAGIWLFLVGCEIKFLLTFLGISALLTSKSIHEGIIFVFRMRQFDIGDYCIIDNQEMVVKDMGIFSTVFNNEQNHTVSFSNTALATKSIQNISRSTVWRETFEFRVKTTKNLDRKIEHFEFKINGFLKSKLDIWSDGHSFSFKDKAENRSRYALRVTHSTKFQNLELNKIQRSELLIEARRFFKEVGIECVSLDSVI